MLKPIFSHLSICIATFAFTISFMSCGMEEQTVDQPKITSMNEIMIEAPIAKKVAKEITTHGDTRIDNYYWMKLSDEQKK